MPDVRQLGDLQLAILRVLWDREEASAAQVHAELLAERGLAPTTIATMLTKMEKRALVDHRSEGRQYIYRALIERGEVSRRMVSEFVDRLFLGDPAALMNHLLREHEIDSDELATIRRQIADRQRQDPPPSDSRRSHPDSRTELGDE